MFGVIGILVGILCVLFGALGVLFGVIGILFGVICVLFGVLGVLFGVLGVFVWRTLYIFGVHYIHIFWRNWCLWRWDVVFITFRIWDGASNIFITKNV